VVEVPTIGKAARQVVERAGLYVDEKATAREEKDRRV
jgi:hypothetical protein